MPIVTDPSEGPCSENNGGCDHICSVDSGMARCYCRAGYFSVAFLPTKCFGKYAKFDYQLLFNYMMHL